jgi:hypothetical protein
LGRAQRRRPRAGQRQGSCVSEADDEDMFLIDELSSGSGRGRHPRRAREAAGKAGVLSDEAPWREYVERQRDNAQGQLRPFKDLSRMTAGKRLTPSGRWREH